EKLIPGVGKVTVGNAKTAADFVTDFAAKAKERSLDHVKRLDPGAISINAPYGGRIGEAFSKISGGPKGIIWQGGDGYLYYNKDPNYVPKSPNTQVWHSNPRTSSSPIQGIANGKPDDRPKDFNTQVLREVAGDYAGDYVKEKVNDILNKKWKAKSTS